MKEPILNYLTLNSFFESLVLLIPLGFSDSIWMKMRTLKGKVSKYVLPLVSWGKWGEWNRGL